jgi:hypothetical protein
VLEPAWFLVTDIGSKRILDWLSGGELQLTKLTLAVEDLRIIQGKTHKIKQKYQVPKYM